MCLSNFVIKDVTKLLNLKKLKFLRNERTLRKKKQLNTTAENTENKST